MIKASLKFLIKTIFFLVPLFFAHLLTTYYIFDLLWPPNIIICYVFNITLAIIIYSGTFFFSLSSSSNTILFYCTGTLFKIFLFLFFLYPKFTFDGEIQNIEFLTFFIPYSACLIIEIYELLRFLNSRE
ncbi:MAG: hypothetical protein ACI914_000226 [Candidatus Marivariicella framensis]|jgi:hypothetical protein